MAPNVIYDGDGNIYSRGDEDSTQQEDIMKKESDNAMVGSGAEVGDTMRTRDNVSSMENDNIPGQEDDEKRTPKAAKSMSQRVTTQSVSQAAKTSVPQSATTSLSQNAALVSSINTDSVLSPIKTDSVLSSIRSDSSLIKSDWLAKIRKLRSMDEEEYKAERRVANGHLKKDKKGESKAIEMKIEYPLEAHPLHAHNQKFSEKIFEEYLKGTHTNFVCCGLVSYYLYVFFCGNESLSKNDEATTDGATKAPKAEEVEDSESSSEAEEAHGSSIGSSRAVISSAKSKRKTSDKTVTKSDQIRSTSATNSPCDIHLMEGLGRLTGIVKEGTGASTSNGSTLQPRFDLQRMKRLSTMGYGVSDGTFGSKKLKREEFPADPAQQAFVEQVVILQRIQHLALGVGKWFSLCTPRARELWYRARAGRREKAVILEEDGKEDNLDEESVKEVRPKFIISVVQGEVRIQRKDPWELSEDSSDADRSDKSSNDRSEENTIWAALKREQKKQKTEEEKLLLKVDADKAKSDTVGDALGDTCTTLDVGGGTDINATDLDGSKTDIGDAAAATAPKEDQEPRVNGDEQLSVSKPPTSKTPTPTTKSPPPVISPSWSPLRKRHSSGPMAGYYPASVLSHSVSLDVHHGDPSLKPDQELVKRREKELKELLKQKKRPFNSSTNKKDDKGQSLYYSKKVLPPKKQAELDALREAQRKEKSRGRYIHQGSGLPLIFFMDYHLDDEFISLFSNKKWSPMIQKLNNKIERGGHAVRLHVRTVVKDNPLWKKVVKTVNSTKDLEASSSAVDLTSVVASAMSDLKSVVTQNLDPFQPMVTSAAPSKLKGFLCSEISRSNIVVQKPVHNPDAVSEADDAVNDIEDRIETNADEDPSDDVSNEEDCSGDEDDIWNLSQIVSTPKKKQQKRGKKSRVRKIIERLSPKRVEKKYAVGADEDSSNANVGLASFLTRPLSGNGLMRKTSKDKASPAKEKPGKMSSSISKDDLSTSNSKEKISPDRTDTAATSKEKGGLKASRERPSPQRDPQSKSHLLLPPIDSSTSPKRIDASASPKRKPVQDSKALDAGVLNDSPESDPDSSDSPNCKGSNNTNMTTNEDPPDGTIAGKHDVSNTDGNFLSRSESPKRSLAAPKASATQQPPKLIAHILGDERERQELRSLFYEILSTRRNKYRHTKLFTRVSFTRLSAQSDFIGAHAMGFSVRSIMQTSPLNSSGSVQGADLDPSASGEHSTQEIRLYDPNRAPIFLRWDMQGYTQTTNRNDEVHSTFNSSTIEASTIDHEKTNHTITENKLEKRNLAMKNCISFLQDRIDEIDHAITENSKAKHAGEQLIRKNKNDLINTTASKPTQRKDTYRKDFPVNVVEFPKNLQAGDFVLGYPRPERTLRNIELQKKIVTTVMQKDVSQFMKRYKRSKAERDDKRDGADEGKGDRKEKDEMAPPKLSLAVQSKLFGGSSRLLDDVDKNSTATDSDDYDDDCDNVNSSNKLHKPLIHVFTSISRLTDFIFSFFVDCALPAEKLHRVNSIVYGLSVWELEMDLPCQSENSSEAGEPPSQRMKRNHQKVSTDHQIRSEVKIPANASNPYVVDETELIESKQALAEYDDVGTHVFNNDIRPDACALLQRNKSRIKPKKPNTRSYPSIADVCYGVRQRYGKCNTDSGPPGVSCATTNTLSNHGALLNHGKKAIATMNNEADYPVSSALLKAYSSDKSALPTSDSSRTLASLSPTPISPTAKMKPTREPDKFVLERLLKIAGTDSPDYDALLLWKSISADVENGGIGGLSGVMEAFKRRLGSCIRHQNVQMAKFLKMNMESVWKSILKWERKFLRESSPTISPSKSQQSLTRSPSKDKNSPAKGAVDADVLRDETSGVQAHLEGGKTNHAGCEKDSAAESPDKQENPLLLPENQAKIGTSQKLEFPTRPETPLKIHKTNEEEFLELCRIFIEQLVISTQSGSAIGHCLARDFRQHDFLGLDASCFSGKGKTVSVFLQKMRDYMREIEQEMVEEKMKEHNPDDKEKTNRNDHYEQHSDDHYDQHSNVGINAINKDGEYVYSFQRQESNFQSSSALRTIALPKNITNFPISYYGLLQMLRHIDNPIFNWQRDSANTSGGMCTGGGGAFNINGGKKSLLPFGYAAKVRRQGQERTGVCFLDEPMIVLKRNLCVADGGERFRTLLEIYLGDIV